MARTETLRRAHEHLDGERFDRDASDVGEGHFSLEIVVRVSNRGDEIEFVSVEAEDIHTGDIYDEDLLNACASEAGQEKLDALVQESIAAFRESGITNIPCNCELCQAVPNEDWQ